MIVGTRGSKLALVQTDYIRKCLYDITGEEVEKNIIKTKGDKITNSQLYEDLEIVAVPPREKPNEVLVSNYSWKELEEGSTLGTSSLRREAFCKFHNREFELKPIRGNIETRIKKVTEEELDATIMAEAGLNRLGLQKYIKTEFPTDYFMPAAGQGALAVITRRDSEVKETIKKLDDYFSHQRVLSEKAILQEMGVGCQWPIGAIANIKDNKLEIKSILLDKNGEVLYEEKLTGSVREAETMGRKIGKEMLDYI